MGILLNNSQDSFLKSFRKFMCGRDSDFVFRRAFNPLNNSIGETSIYVHIPFCKSLCPYCPYNRIPFDEVKLKNYMDSLLREIESFAERNPNLHITSVYYGGGTPLLAGKRIAEANRLIRRLFAVSKDFSIEVNPNDIDENAINLLKEAEFTSISVGVQSFNDKLLEKIGRKYTALEARKKLAMIMGAGFEWVNFDMLFALPKETDEDLKTDIQEALKFKPSQITAYPLFTFPYSEISNFKRVRRVKSPSILKRRRMYYSLYKMIENSGYERCSVWSFRKAGSVNRYSSVTRERYVGFGASAGSYYESHFDLNTFNVNEYIDSVNKRGNAIALRIPFTKRMAKMYDFYWRIYDTRFMSERNLSTFSYNMEKDQNITLFLKILIYLNFAENGQHHFSLTKRGSMWVHLLQNLLSLRAIDRVWGRAKKDAWP
ncbi:MAG: coproporphyrinogen-III oxidase family protein, partial [bacterium]